MTKSVTILIPTHERRKYLTRAMAYYGTAPFPVVVADSSKSACDICPSHVTYLHLPAMTLQQKMFHALSLLRTDLVVVCADDDFTVVKSITKAAQFLDAHPDYSSAQGAFVMFDPSVHPSPRFFPQYIHGYELNICQNDAKGRLTALFGNYMHTTYALCKVDLMRRVFGDLCEFDIRNYCLLELLQACYCIINGKHKALPIFWAARECNSGGDNEPELRVKLDAIVVSDNHKQEYERLVNAITLFYVEKEAVAYEVAESVVRGAVQSYLDSIRERTLGRVHHDQVPRLRWMRSAVGAQVASMLRWSRCSDKTVQSWFRAVFSKHYVEGNHHLFVAASLFSGVPFFSREGLREIAGILYHVQRFPARKALRGISR